MCGIAGIVALDGFDPKTLVGMTQMISYRGPNGYGFAYSNAGTDAKLRVFHGDERIPWDRNAQVGLGNRRLAIVDLSANGNQPMQVDDGRLCITYNGEIYNYKEIRQELHSLGHQFSSGTDTEVILRSYSEWGEQCLSRFNGMWSFALWDRTRQLLFCSRDRFGVKPFYFCASNRAFYFGSEIKQVLFASGIKRVANRRAIAEFLEWGLQDHLPETSFQGVFQLLGGHSLALDLREPLRPRIERYWELKTAPQLDITPAQAAEEFHSQFERAVKIRLRSDVPVGVSLSGGLDSSAVLCEARRVSQKACFQCFSACFEDARIDERPYMSTVTTATGSAGHWTFPDAESFWKAAETIAYHQDEPIGGPSVFAQWSVMREARENGVPVLLGGQGGDESLCGYRKYYFFHVWHLLRGADPLFFREAIALAAGLARYQWSIAAIGRYLPSVAQKRVSAVDRLASATLRKVAGEFPRILGPGSSLAERQKTDLLKSSIPKLLRHEDRNSMAHSIESRLPFLDYQLVEFAVRCPPSLKLKNGWTKWILRKALEGTLPDAVRLRKSKLGFDTPQVEWLRLGLTNGHGHLWQSPDLRMRELLSPDRLATECTRFLSDAPGSLPAEALFRALSLELWAKVHNVN
ncbi:MAG TPA: asparagine synthase (glutamine-hydrolyzing) [Verrucomicrobiae bacterium]|nr:asparagine synthase (glutamine-hydrolyzing) [Verrucomicrobiae bacterium]